MELKTPLYDAHVKAGGKIVSILQDISYRYSMEQVLSQSIWQLEKKQDFFDVSHMGEVLCQGKDALANLQKLLTNDFYQHGRWAGKIQPDV
mgnify:CR=1 FL=1